MKKPFKILTNILIVLLLIISSLFLIKDLTCMNVVVSGSSMSPTLKSGDYGLALSTKSAKNKAKRFQIVVFENNGTLLIKRLIALSGESIRIDPIDGALYVNEEKVEQKFISNEVQLQTCFNNSNRVCSSNQSIIVPENYIFVLGDNRSNSFDSAHGLGFINKNDIKGILKVTFAQCQSIDENSSNVCVNKKYNSWKWY